jgi:hypothetical protein
VSGMIEVPFGQTVVRRIEPLGPPQAYKTYGMSFPRKTHWRPATCEEALCLAFLNGWKSTFDLSTDLGQKQYKYCKDDRERSFQVERGPGTLVSFTYGPGNRCFRSGEHVVPLERLPVLYVAEGDWRGNPRGTPRRIHTRPMDWVEDMAENQDRLSTALERG